MYQTRGFEKASEHVDDDCGVNDAQHGAEGKHDVGGDDVAALEEDRGARGMVQVGHLQHGWVSVHRHIDKQPVTST